MQRITFYLAALAALALSGNANAQIRVFKVALDGKQARTSSTGTGTATVILDRTAGVVNLTGTYTGLGSNRTIQHVHLGKAGTSGGIVFGLAATGTTSGSFSGSARLTAASITTLLGDGMYINIHSLTFGAGEIRGQIIGQGPDILISSGSSDGAYALVDKNKDGKYTTSGEAWDYVLALRNTSPRNYVLNGTKIFFTDTGRDQVVWVEDANKDGLIDPATERHVFYNVNAGVGGTVPAFCTMGRDGWLWWVNDGGTGEGIYRSKDLNNDGDAEDTGETIAVLTETMTRVKIANTPKTTAFLNGTVRTLSTTEIDSIIFDATYGNYGRFIIEDEWCDQTLCLEDKNGDNDFNDLGECYLFCALYAGSTVTAPRTSRIDHDVNPDVTSKKFNICNEIRNHAIDTSTTPTTYYLMSGETGAITTSVQRQDQALIFKGQDKNNDGDINDAGELTEFWDGALNSTGASKVHNFTLGMASDASGGVLYVNAEWDGVPDHEQLIMLKDGNGDGDANDAGETTVLWDLGVDRTHYTPSVFPAGTLSTLRVQTTLTVIFYYGVATCASSLSATAKHNIQFGRSTTTSGSGKSKNPNIGNTKWLVRTWGAKGSATGAYSIGFTKIPAGVALDGGGTCFAYQTFDVIALYFTTSSGGANDQIVPVPNNVAFLGLRTYWQSIVADATAPGGLGITLSDAFDMTIGDWTYTK